MAQNINLLEEISVSPVSVYNCKLIINIVISWTLLLTLIYAVAITIHSNQKNLLSELENTQNVLMTKIAGYKRELATFEPAYMNDLSPNSGNLLGFSRYLEDLAKFIPQGVWLNEIIFSEPDGNVTFKGSSIAASGISTMLDALGKSQSLKDKNFSALQLEQNTDNGTDFTINTVTIADTDINKQP